jgi:hypothetical protein
MSDIILTDFPKLYCPFIRQTFKVDVDMWKEKGAALQLREPEAYLVIDRINPGYEWVFEDKETFAVEKLNGTNVKILTEKGMLRAVFNRKNPIDPLQIFSGKTFIMEAIFKSIDKGYVNKDGEQAGEVIGPKVQGNPYKLLVHEWYPFERTISALRYKSFEEHDRTFDNWSSWFKDFLFSRYFTKKASKEGTEEKVFAEGVIFYNLKRKAEGKTWMAKLRRDMFDWYYSDSIKIIGYSKQGTGVTEDQEKFE